MAKTYTWQGQITEEIEHCEQLTPQGQTACESAGCYWYAYPNPIGEPACFGKPIYIQYLPIIAVGIGAIVVAAALLSGRKAHHPYYPPPPPSYLGGRP